MPVWSRQQLLLRTLSFHGTCVHLRCGCWFHCRLASSTFITCLSSHGMTFLISRCSAQCVTLLSNYFYFQSVFFSSVMKYKFLYMLLLHPEPPKDILLFLCLLVHCVPLVHSLSSAVFWWVILFKGLPANLEVYADVVLVGFESNDCIFRCILVRPYLKRGGICLQYMSQVLTTGCGCSNSASPLSFLQSFLSIQC